MMNSFGTCYKPTRKPSKKQRDMENLLKIIKTIEATHKGLGVPLAYNLLCVLSNQSNFIVGSSGKGKTHMIFSIIDACKTLPNSQINNWNAMTYYELVEKIGMRVNQSLIWTVEEWSMLSDYHRELLMAIASKVQTDRNFERLVKVGTYSQLISIQNCDLVLLVAIQPFKFRKLMKESDNWNSLASDRFTKQMLINPLMKDTKNFFPKFTLPDCLFFNRTRDYNLPANALMVNLFDEHLTQGRAELASIKFAESWCRLNDQETFTDVDALCFRSMFEPYLSLYPLMIKVVDPDQEESFYTGPFRILEYFMRHYGKKITVHEVERAFHMVDTDDSKQMSERTIYRHLQVLERHGLVVRNSPDYDLSPYLHNFFDNYKENWAS